MANAFEVKKMTQPSHISTLEQDTTLGIQLVYTDISHATAQIFTCEMPHFHNAITSEQNLFFSCSAPADNLLLDIPVAYKRYLSDYAITIPRYYRYQLCISLYGVVFSTAVVVGISNLSDQSKVFDPGITLLLKVPDNSQNSVLDQRLVLWTQGNMVLWIYGNMEYIKVSIFNNRTADSWGSVAAAQIAMQLCKSNSYEIS